MASSEEMKIEIPEIKEEMKIEILEIKEEEMKIEIPEIEEEEVENEENVGAGPKYLTGRALGELSNTFSVMATVIGGASFSAIITLPSDNLGSKSEPTSWLYTLFILSNFLAVFSAIFTVAHIIWAKLVDRKLAGCVLEYSAAYLGFAMISMSLAITCEAGVVLKNSRLIQLFGVALGMFFTGGVCRFVFPLLNYTRWGQI